MGICRGLEAIHTKGYAHRSVGKPCPVKLEVSASTSNHLPSSGPLSEQVDSGSCPFPCRDLKPTNILLGEEGQPVLMDLGSMNQAHIRVESSRQALALQVSLRPLFSPAPVLPFHHPFQCLSKFGSLTMTCSPHLGCGGRSRTGLPSGALSPTGPLSSSPCRATVSLTSGPMSG